MTSHARALGAVLSGVCLLAAGCGFRGTSSLPLPGGVGGADTYRVTVVLDDATDLVPKETCRSNDVTVGSVDSVVLGPDLKAHVTCVLENSAALPANTVATLQETSLLGERFIALGPPKGLPPNGKLRPGTVVPDSGARVDPDAEQVLGALSAVLNGGDLTKIQVISKELTDALTGHQGDIRSLLDRTTALTGELNQHSADITHALDALDHLSGSLAARRDALGSALDSVPPGLKVLNDQRPQLLNLLRELTRLSSTAVPLIEASKANTTQDLRLLQPILDGLAANGGQLTGALRAMLTYPFPNNGPAATKGDYAGLSATFNLDLDTLNTLLAQEQQASGPSPVPPGPVPGLPGGGLPGLPPLPGLLPPGAPGSPPPTDIGGLLLGVHP